MTDDKRAFRGIWIPAELWLSDLSVTQKVLMAEIDSLDGEQGCFASNAHFAKFLKCDKMYVSQLISKLTEDGWITAEAFDGRRRVLHSNLALLLGKRVQLQEAPETAPPGLIQAEERAEAIAVLRQIDGFLELWQKFKEHRKALKAAMTPHAQTLMLDKLHGFHTAGMDVIEIMKQSITAGWKDTFPKVGSTKKMHGNKTEKANPTRITEEGFGDLSERTA